MESSEISNNKNAQVTIRLFFKGIFFLVDGVIDVYFDNKPIGKGSSVKGMDLTIITEPGKHTLTLHLLGGIRTRWYMLNLSPSTKYEINLKYSRIWGNFTRNPNIRITDIKN